MKAVHTNRFRRHALAAGMAAALGTGVAQADEYVFRFGSPGTPLTVDGAGAITPNDGLFTMLDPTGKPLGNTSNPYYSDPTWSYGLRTQIQGTLTYDTETGTGSMTIVDFEFFNGSLPAAAQAITIEDIGDGGVGGSNLMLGNMLFNWNGTDGIPVSIVWDATGLQTAISSNRFDGTPLSVNDVITGGATPASNGIKLNQIPIGPAPVATTTWNTTTVVGAGLGTNPSGVLPLIADTIGGTPMVAGPFSSYNANFDLTSLTLTSFTDTTAPVITLGGSNPTVLSVGGTFTETATCTDAIDGAIAEGPGAFVIDASALDVNTPGSYVITYDCQDSSGNTSVQGSRTVNVQAATAPVITLVGDNPLSFEAAASYTDPGATCVDDYDDNGIDPGDGAIVPTIAVNTVVSDVPGNYSVTWDCTDSDGELATTARSVTVVDTTPPDITLSAACPIVVMGGPGFVDPTPTATATDIVDGDLSGSVVVSGGPVTNPTFAAGELSRTFNLGYSVSDAAGNDAVEACQVIVGNPTPVVTLTGDSVVTVDEGDGYADPGATCQDFNPASPGTPDTLTPVTADITIDTTTPAGSYTITYSCTDGDMNTGTTTRSVTVAGAGSYTAAATTSGSNFTMLDPSGQYVGGAPDIYSNWDGSMLTSTAQTTINMTMGSALPTPFFGFPWTAHDIRVFGPGSYTLTTSRGNPLSFTVGQNQIGAHMLFDWNNNNNIDVAIVWNINGTFDGNGPVSGQVFNLVSVDGDGDGYPGIRMPDGPFTGFSANFNINFTPAYSLPTAEAPLLSADQGGDTTRTVITGGGNVTVSASTGASFDWSGSDAALVSRAVGGTTGATFTFDPSTLTVGTYTVSVAIDGGTATGSLLISVVSSDGGLDVADDDNDGIPNYLDDDASGATPTAIQVSPGGVSVVSSDGNLELGDTAFVTGAAGVGVTAADIVTGGGIADTASSEACIGGCFDFTITGLTPGDSVQVVLPLSTTIPADAVYRKLIGGTWRDFSATGSNAVASAASVAGVCPGVGGSYTAGLNAGHDCVRLTLVDGGPNDADGLPNGIVKDPGGVAVAAAVDTPVSTIGSPGTGGGCALSTDTAASQRLDLWLMAGLLGLLGLRRGLQRH